MIEYSSRRMCYSTAKLNEVEMLDLETGERLIWTSSERRSEARCFVSLSGRYLVMDSLDM